MTQNIKFHLRACVFTKFYAYTLVTRKGAVLLLVITA